MSRTRRDVAFAGGAADWLPIGLALLVTALTMFFAADPARGADGYQLAPDPVLVAGIEFPHGVAVDQANHRVYVAVVSDDPKGGQPGSIHRYESNGAAAGTFPADLPSFFTGVAVNPVTQGFYGAEVRLETPQGNFGTAQMDPFSSAGTLGTPFALSASDTYPQIATDSIGDVYFPNAATKTVQVFNAAGALQETIACGGCPGGAFGRPVSVAVDSADNLYVVDLSPDRVIKFTLSAGSYKFASLLQSGRGAGAVGVDPSTDDVFVGDFPNGSNYHVVAYDSSGTQFDDFGAGLFINPLLGINVVPQIAADATTHKLYLTETNKIYVFERATIGPMSVTSTAASAIGQLTATLSGTVNANGHAALECEFEYTLDADVGFASATSLPCPKLPDGSASTALSVKASLSANTAYRYRVTATNNGGTTSSVSKTFKTLPAIPPTVTTDPPFAVTQTGATIKGEVNPRGGAVSDCHFDFGPSTSYGSSFPCANVPGPVTTDVAETRDLSGLAAGSTYHYRLVVSTNAGTAQGNDVAFTTVSAPSNPGAASGPTGPPSGPAEPPQCKRGFRLQGSGTQKRCVKACKKGFRRKRVHGKVRCVKRKPANPRRKRLNPR